jgi:hypothetical protein
MQNHIASSIARNDMSENSYKYYGVLVGDRTPDRPAGVVRVWTGPDGEQMEESFTSSLAWEPSHRFSSMARPDYKTIVEIDESVVVRFIERVTKKITTERESSGS